MEDIVHGMLPNWLYMNDINSMAHSIESRSPFLDVELAKYAKLPGATKFKDGYNKHLLRERLPGMVGDKIKWRRDKQGFRWSAGGYVRNNRKEIRDVINNSILLKKMQDLKQVKDIFGPDLGITVGALTLFSLGIFGETFPDIEINANC